MKKTLFRWLIALAVILPCLLLSVSAATPERYWSYDISDDGEAIITGTGAYLSDIAIPSTLGGFPVTAIGSYAFYEYPELKSITIPNSVTSIGFSAFEGCTNLKSITIPNSVTSIGKCAFLDCTSLESITIPNSVTSIGEGAFYNTKYYKTQSNWENNALYIGKHLIGVDSEISGSYAVNDGTLCIAEEAFEGCDDLTSVTIPNSVRYIGAYAFCECPNLTSVTIPNSVTYLGYFAFSECTGLRSVTLPNSITFIDDFAFVGCTALESITIPNSVTSIGEYAFCNCESLTSITIPSSVKWIGDFAFDGCYALNDVYYAGSEAEWNRIDFTVDNECLTNATIHYNSSAASGSSGIALSATNLSAEVYTEQSIYVFKGVGAEDYKKSFRVTTSDSAVVSATPSGNKIILRLKSTGSAKITVSATDGSGDKAVCNVTVTEPKNPAEVELLRRFALSKLVYKNLKEDTKVKNQPASSTNRKSVMYYYEDGDTVTWDALYWRYIDNYTVIKTYKGDDGFYGAAFQAPNNGEIIIAYRGTQPDTWADIATDAAMVFGVLNRQFDDALYLYDQVKKVKSECEISLTGWSLGGALASYVAVNRGVRCDNVNGATGWLLGNKLLASNVANFANFLGFDQYVHEYINGCEGGAVNNGITRLAFLNMPAINYKFYVDTDNYNEKYSRAKNVGAGHRFEIVSVDAFQVDHHEPSSIINYSDGKFSLTKVERNHSTPWAIDGDGYYIGTSRDDYAIANFEKSLMGMIVFPAQYMLGGKGNDTIIAGIGNDTLIGNAGNDVLNGAAGNDTYVFGGNFGKDIIKDPSGKDKLLFTDRTLADLTISGNKIICGSNSIELSTEHKRNATSTFTLSDVNGVTRTINVSKVSTYSIRSMDADTTKGIWLLGSATAEIYDANEELMDTLIVTAETAEAVEYKDYGMVVFAPQQIGFTLPHEGYIIKVKSDEAIGLWAVSDADDPTVAKQTIADGVDLSDGSTLVVNTGEMEYEQLSVRLVSGDKQTLLYSDAPEPLVITADKTAIKTGETIIMSVPDVFADSVTWECVNGNAVITKNEDLSVSVIGMTTGEETIRAYLPNDALYSAEASIVVTADDAPAVAVTYKDEVYDGTTTATDMVFFDVSMPDGYDTIVFDTASPYAPIEDTNTFVVSGVGYHTINVYCKNAQTGAKTASFTFDFSQDDEAPEVSGVEQDGVYYTDRIIDIFDDELSAVYINGELCEQEQFIISDVGCYQITAADAAGNTTSVSFEIKSMPNAADIRRADEELVWQIRNEFEAVKYSFAEERMEELETKISLLEGALCNVMTVEQSDGGVVSIDKSIAALGETVTITTTPAEGYALQEIYVDGVAIEGDTFTVTGAHTVTAKFVALAEFYGANVDMGNKLAMNFVVAQSYFTGLTGLYAEVVGPDAASTVPGVTKTVRVEQKDWVENGPYFMFTYDGIAAKQMGDEITVTIYNARGNAISKVWVDSMSEYIKRKLEDQGKEGKALFVDMLNYGAAAQVKFGYDTENLANSWLTDEQKAYGSAEMAACTNNLVKGSNYMGTSLVLASRISMQFAFENVKTTKLYALVSFTDHMGKKVNLHIDNEDIKVNGNYRVVTVEEMVVADGRQLITCKLYNEKTKYLMGRCDDSMESYIARKATGDNEWMKAIMIFSDSAYAYIHRNDPK